MNTPPLNSIIGLEYEPDYMSEPEIKSAIILLEQRLLTDKISHSSVICLLRLRMALSNFQEARELMIKQIVE